MNASTLIAGVGNIFFADDGFGVDVARRLDRETLPPSVTVRDYGIRALQLAYALLDPWDRVVLVDALPHGEPAGTLCLVEPEVEPNALPTADAHGMNLSLALATASSLRGSLPSILVVGCEPATVDEGMGLSSAVAAAVPEAMEMIREMVENRASCPGSEQAVEARPPRKRS